MGDDALVAKRMNLGPGGKQPAMRDTIWNGQVQKLVDESGRPIGARALLQKRGIDTKGLKLDDMRDIISKFPNFAGEKCQLEHILNNRGHVCIFIPKFIANSTPLNVAGHKVRGTQGLIAIILSWASERPFQRP